MKKLKKKKKLLDWESKSSIKNYFYTWKFPIPTKAAGADGAPPGAGAPAGGAWGGIPGGGYGYIGCGGAGGVSGLNFSVKIY